MGEDSKNIFTGTLYYQRKLKWYEQIWYFITRKKNELIPLGTGTIEIKGEDEHENNDKSTYER